MIKYIFNNKYKINLFRSWISQKPYNTFIKSNQANLELLISPQDIQHSVKDVGNVNSIFILFIFNVKVLPKACFIYYNMKSNSIVEYKYNEGKSYYKSFISFIEKTLMKYKNSFPKDTVILAPKYYINKSLIERCQNTLELSLVGYDRKFLSNLNQIKNRLMSLVLIEELNDNSFRKVINEFNSCKLINNDVPVTFQTAFNQIRSYSTSTNNRSLESITPKWTFYIFKIPNLIIDNQVIRISVTKFWDEIVTQDLKSNRNLKISIQFRVRFEGNIVRSISNLDVVTIKHRDALIDAYSTLWAIKNDVYQGVKPIEIMFWYKYQPENFKTKLSGFREELNFKKLTKFEINSKLPNNMDINSWGKCVFDAFNNIYSVSLKEWFTANVISNKTYNLVLLSARQLRGSINVCKFRDVKGKDPKDLYTFKRVFDGVTIYFKNGIQSFFTQLIEVDFIEKIHITNPKEPDYKIITMDLETKEVLDGELTIMEPVCISIFIGGKSKDSSSILSFKIWDYKSKEEMIIAAFNSILLNKYKGYSVYFHNFSYFDSIFILKVLVNIADTKTNLISREGKLLRVNVQYGKYFDTKTKSTKYYNSLNIFDSFLILPSSLEKLGKTFNLEQKGFFPLKILNDPEIKLTYEGEFPPIKYFYHPKSLNKKAYDEFVNKYEILKSEYLKSSHPKWNLKNELVKYCEQDVITLHHVIQSFTKEIYDKFGINILKYPTLPSIAFVIFRSNFMEYENIPIICGGIYNDIKGAYYGGFVDVYKPFAQNVKSYDVNSLYPTSMKNCPLPTGNPIYYEGDPREYFSSIFGFVYAKIQAPNLRTPILPVKITNLNGSPSTIYPTGSWTGWYFSEELLNATKYGYTFDIIKGYHFEKSVLFSSYVEHLYKIKCSVDSSSPWYAISKLLLNSLYGRFGMSPELEKNEIVSETMLDDLNDDPKVIISKCENLGDKFWISYKDERRVTRKHPNVSVPVAAAIASWSRIHMTEYIVNHSYDISAVDTDGIKTSRELNSKFIGKELGQMKDEGTFLELTCIAPKVYGGITTNHLMVVKVKGVKELISYWTLKLLLYMDVLKISQSKWYRNFTDATINIVDQIYTLAVTNNKREIVLDSCGKFIDTKPYHVIDGQIVYRKSTKLYYLPPVGKVLYLSPPTYLLLPAPCYLALPSPDYLALPAPSDFPMTKGSLPTIFYMEAPLPAIFYMEAPLPAIFYTETSLHIHPAYLKIIWLPKPLNPPKEFDLFLWNNFKIISLLLLLAFTFSLFLFISSSQFWEQSSVESYINIDILESEIECPSFYELNPANKYGNSSELNLFSYLWDNYKTVIIALGIMGLSLAFWYWVSKDSSSGGNSPNFDNIPTISYENRGLLRRSIRDSFFDDTRLASQLRDRNEDLALQSINLNTRHLSREEMIQIIHESAISPNTSIDAVQALLREAAREVPEVTYSNSLIPCNSVTDLVVYNPQNIPIPASVNMVRYEFFSQYLDHYNAIIAAYGV